MHLSPSHGSSTKQFFRLSHNENTTSTNAEEANKPVPRQPDNEPTNNNNELPATSFLYSSPNPKKNPVRKRRIRRGKYNKNVNNDMYKKDKFSILHTNIQSSKNKLNSLVAIIKSLDVNIVTINETHLKANGKLNIEGYKTFTRNRKDQAKGGMATSVKNKNAATSLKVGEGEFDEYIITHHGEFQPAINVINYYGKQETR